MAKKSVVIYCRMEVIDFDEETEKRAAQEALKNKGIWQSIPGLPRLNLNEERPYYIFYEGHRRFRQDERFTFADWFSTEAVKAVIDNGEAEDEESKIPYCLFIRKEKETK